MLFFSNKSKAALLAAIILLSVILANLIGCTGQIGQEDALVSQSKSSEDTIILESSKKGELQENNSNIQSSSNKDESVENEQEVLQSIELTEQEKLNYYGKYINPFYITGLMYENWDDVSDIDVNRLLKFYEYNGYFDQLPQILSSDPEKYKDASTVDMPAEDVESFMTYYFDVEQEYLHTADNYNSDTGSYAFSINSGIGGGSGLELVQLQKDGQNLVFHCKDILDKQITLTVRVEGEDNFKYISGMYS